MFQHEEMITIVSLLTDTFQTRYLTHKNVAENIQASHVTFSYYDWFNITPSRISFNAAIALIKHVTLKL